MGLGTAVGCKRRFVAVTAVLSVVLDIVPAGAGRESDGQLREAPGPAAVAGELIVRLRPDFGACAHCLVAERRGLRALTGTYVLDQLRLRHHITAMEPLFGGVHARKQRVAARRRFGRRSSPSLGNPAAPLEQIYLVRVDPKSDLTRLAAEFRRDPNVVSAEPNYLYSARDEGGGEVLAHREPASEHISDFPLPPDDPFFDSDGSWGQDFPDLWGLFQIEAPAAWQRSLGEGVVVAVADSGLDVEHPDIAPNLWQNETEIPANGLDDDGNGYVDDVHGWDFTRCVFFSVSEGCIQDKEQGVDVSDGLGHGTHVAGIIAAAGNNGEGVIGVAPRAEVMVVKVLNAEGRGSLRDAAEGLLYAAEQGARVINASWSGPPSDTITEVVQYIRAEFNVVVVGAAGNDHVPLERGMYPAGLPEALGVGAVTHNDEQAEFSNFGGPLDLVGPGGGEKEPEGVLRPDRSILSLLARGSEFGTICYSEFPCDEDLDECEPIEVCDVAPWVVGGRYVRRGGTSMAAPYVSGVAALVLGAHPEFSAGQVRQALLEGADDLGPAGWDKDYGYGRVNARRAVELGVLPVAEIRVPENRAKVWERNFPLEVRGTAAGGQGVLTRWRLEIAPADGGETAEVVRGATAVLDAPLGSVAFDSPLPLERGKRYRLTLHVEDASGAVASDSKTFLVPSPKFSLIPVPDPLGVGGFALTMSGDGQRIALTRTWPGTRDNFVALYDANQGMLARFDRAQRPIFSADGEFLVFDDTTYPDGGWLLHDVAHNTALRLPFPRALNPTSVVVSEHGERIGVITAEDLEDNVGNADHSTEVFVLDVSHGEVRQITNAVRSERTPEIIDLTMSPDAAWLAFSASVDLDETSSTGGTFQVFLYNDEERSIRQVTGRDPSLRLNTCCPAVARSGSRLAYKAGALHVLDTASDVDKVIVETPSHLPLPLLSADGDKLGFVAAVELDPGIVNEDLSPELFVLDLDTGDVAQVTDRLTLLEPSSVCMGLHGDVFALNRAGRVNGTPLRVGPTRLVPLRRPNASPILLVAQTFHAEEGRPFRESIRAQDTDGDHLTFYAHLADREAGSMWSFASWRLHDYGNGTADLELYPRYNEAGEYKLVLAVFDQAGGMDVRTRTLLIEDTQPEGDADCDGDVDSEDIMALIASIFSNERRQECPTGDVTDDGHLGAEDIVGLITKIGTGK